MKNLKLAVTETKNKAGKFTYDVIAENGDVLCTRKSNRIYEACFVTEWRDEKGVTHYDAPYYFGRLDLVGKGDSRHLAADPSRIYALAKINI